MTFQDARARLLAKFAAAQAELMMIVSDVSWCNTSYKGYTETLKKHDDIISGIIKLNAVASEAMRNK